MSLRALPLPKQAGKTVYLVGAAGVLQGASAFAPMSRIKRAAHYGAALTALVVPLPRQRHTTIAALGLPLSRATKLLAYQVDEERQRSVAVVRDLTGRLLVTKTAPVADSGLRREIDFLTVQRRVGHLDIPVLEGVEENGDRLSMTVEFLRGRRPQKREALTILRGVLSDLRSSGLTHGDLAPWNLRVGKDKIALVDWESTSPYLPLRDALHFLLQCTVLLGWFTPAQSASLVRLPGSAISDEADEIGMTEADRVSVAARDIRYRLDTFLLTEQQRATLTSIGRHLEEDR